MNWIASKVIVSFFVLISFISLPAGQDLFAMEGNGELTGNIHFSGVSPKIKNEIITLNPEICGNQVQLEDFMVNPENHGVNNVFVSLKSRLEEASSGGETDSVIINNVKCRIEPAVIRIKVNQIMSIRNSDPIFHSLQFLNKERLIFDAALPKNSNVLRKKFGEPGVIRVKCAIHPFMQGVIYVTDTPTHTLTDRNGTFRLTDIKPGRYILKVRHKSLKPVEREIEIVPGKNSGVSLTVEKTDE